MEFLKPLWRKDLLHHEIHDGISINSGHLLLVRLAAARDPLVGNAQSTQTQRQSSIGCGFRDGRAKSTGQPVVLHGDHWQFTAGEVFGNEKRKEKIAMTREIMIEK